MAAIRANAHAALADTRGMLDGTGRALPSGANLAGDLLHCHPRAPANLLAFFTTDLKLLHRGIWLDGISTGLGRPLLVRIAA